MQLLVLLLLLMKASVRGGRVGVVQQSAERTARLTGVSKVKSRRIVELRLRTEVSMLMSWWRGADVAVTLRLHCTAKLFPGLIDHLK